MAFFRSFLIKNSQEPDTTFAEHDEAALVMFLLQARLRHSAVDLHIPPDFKAPDRLPREFPEQELKFVAGFLCFFVSKPMQYTREIRAFREYFIPGFAQDNPKQIQLGQALHERFFTATLNDLEGATTLDLFFDLSQIFARAH
jgi:hypothetical protein